MGPDIEFPGDALEPQIMEMGGVAALIKEVGSMAGAGKTGDDLVFDPR